MEGNEGRCEKQRAEVSAIGQRGRKRFYRGKAREKQGGIGNLEEYRLGEEENKGGKGKETEGKGEERVSTPHNARIEENGYVADGVVLLKRKGNLRRGTNDWSLAILYPCLRGR